MNNVVGTFGPELAQARVNDFVREAERLHAVAEALTEQREATAIRMAMRQSRRRAGILTLFPRLRALAAER